MDQEGFQRQILSQIGVADLANSLIEFEDSKSTAIGQMFYCYLN
jgi:hypothetical protein